MIFFRPGGYWAERGTQGFGKVSGVQSFVGLGVSYGNVICVWSADVSGVGAVGSEEVVQGGGEHGTLWNTAADHPGTWDAGEVLALGCSAADESGEPAYEVWAEGAVVEFKVRSDHVPHSNKWSF